MALVFCSSDCWLKAQISFPLTETVELLPCFLRKCLRCLGCHDSVSQNWFFGPFLEACQNRQRHCCCSDVALSCVHADQQSSLSFLSDLKCELLLFELRAFLNF